MEDPVARWFINGRFLTQPQTGVQRYAGELTRAIDARLTADDTLAQRMRWQLIVPANCDNVPAFHVIDVRRTHIGSGQVWEQTILPAFARGGLVNFANLGPLAHGRQIICQHDANVFLEPSSYSWGFRTAYAALLPLLARRAAAVTTVSAFSAAMLERFGVTDERRVTIVPNGHEHALRWRASASRFSVADQLSRPFVFALGSRAKHKQIDLLLGLAPALDALGLDLVVSGGSAAIFAETKSEIAPNVRYLGFVEDDDLAALFKRALCFAFPSRTEGFGIPLLEAMVHGAPIITSACASMPDVCADAALYAPVDQPVVWLEQIKRLAASPTLQADLRARGALRYPRFSWAAGAEAYLALALSLSPKRALTVARAADRIHPAAP